MTLEKMVEVMVVVADVVMMLSAEAVSTTAGKAVVELAMVTALGISGGNGGGTDC